VPACRQEGKERYEKGPVGTGDIAELASLGVQVITQQEVGGHLGDMRQLVHQSKEDTREGDTMHIENGQDYMNIQLYICTCLMRGNAGAFQSKTKGARAI